MVAVVVMLIDNLKSGSLDEVCAAKRLGCWELSAIGKPAYVSNVYF